MKYLLIAAVATTTLLVGCGKSVDVEGRGMYMNANSGIVGIGELEVTTNPEGTEAARLHYSEDTAWLASDVKTHDFKANLYGTNACLAAKAIVRDICNAFAVSTNRFEMVDE